MEFYLTGAIVALGYQLADDDFRLYDTIVCPLLWPFIIVLQIGICIQRRSFVAKTKVGPK